MGVEIRAVCDRCKCVRPFDEDDRRAYDRDCELPKGWEWHDEGQLLCGGCDQKWFIISGSIDADAANRRALALKAFMTPEPHHERAADE